ncbi:MAG TPA: hypothetical protein VM142_10330 [Acidimicrobiales bacterium]|nr:hypothetical protein [Acidimicrobiales bacterium]
MQRGGPDAHSGVEPAPPEDDRGRRVHHRRFQAGGFGRIKVLLQQGRLALPRHPALLSQLSALAFETREAGTPHISVPERAGHDDLAMACAWRWG